MTADNADNAPVDDRDQTFIELGRMTAVVAHEIRNPLAGVSGALQVIGDRLPSTVVEAAIFDEVQERLGALNRLVEQLLMLSRLGAPVPSRAPLPAILRDAPGAAGRALDRPAPVLEIDGPVADLVLSGDHGMLVNMLGFVMAVAVEGQGPRPEALADEIGSPRRVVPLSVTRVESQCRFEIAFGPALPPAEAAAAFEPFATLGGRGAGLSLVIARRIARLHGGELTLDNGAGGARAIGRLPLSE